MRMCDSHRALGTCAWVKRKGEGAHMPRRHASVSCTRHRPFTSAQGGWSGALTRLLPPSRARNGAIYQTVKVAGTGCTPYTFTEIWRVGTTGNVEQGGRDYMGVRLPRNWHGRVTITAYAWYESGPARVGGGRRSGTSGILQSRRGRVRPRITAPQRLLHRKTTIYRAAGGPGIVVRVRVGNCVNAHA